MRIIKSGNLNWQLKPVEFTCETCGCVFEATSTEYQLADQYAMLHDGIKAECKCPCCGHTAHFYFAR